MDRTEREYQEVEEYMELEPIYSGGEDTWWEIESLEVMGNTHENPELLK